MQTQKKSNFKNHLVCGLLTALVIAVFGQVSHFEFIDYDDNVYVFKNRHVQEGLTVQSVRWAFTSMEESLWIPATRLSFILDSTLFGMKPGAFHMVNVAFHIANVLILYFILNRSTGTVWRSAVTAALFAVHPLQVESVAWITERKDVLSVFFMLAALLVYFKYIRKRTIAVYFTVLVLFMFGLMAKPMVMTFPLLLVLLDWWPLGLINPRKNKEKFSKAANSSSTIPEWFRAIFVSLFEKIPFFVLSLLCGFLTLAAGKGEVKTLAEFSLGSRIANAVISYAGYLGKYLWQTKLAFFYPHHPEDVTATDVILSFAVISVLTVMAVYSVKRSPFFLFGWLWYLVTLIPVSGIIQTWEHTMADRFTYMPMIGLSVMVCWGFHDLLLRRRHGRGILIAFTCFSISALMIKSWFQTGTWKDSTTLFTHAITVTRDNHIAHANLGSILMTRGDYSAAVAHYREVLKVKPQSPGVHINIGNALSRLGDRKEALDHFREAVRIEPDNPVWLNVLAMALARENRLDEAFVLLKKALELKPDLTMTRKNLDYVQNAMKAYRNMEKEE